VAQKKKKTDGSKREVFPPKNQGADPQKDPSKWRPETTKNLKEGSANEKLALHVEHVICLWAWESRGDCCNKGVGKNITGSKSGARTGLSGGRSIDEKTAR